MKTSATKLAGLIALLLLSAFSHLFSQATDLHVFQDWADKTGLVDMAYKASSVRDPANQVMYVVGGTLNINGNYDWMINKYDETTGTLIWSVQYDGPAGAEDYATDIIFDANNNLIFVSGAITVDTVQGLDLGVIMLDTSGTQQWLSTYDNGQSYPLYNDVGASITFIDHDDICVTGVSQDASTLEDCVTIRMAAGDGTQNWVARYDESNMQDGGGKVFYDGTDIFVAGLVQRNINYHAVAGFQYDISGNLLASTAPTQTLDSITEIHDATIASNGDIYIAGFLNRTGYARDIKLIKIDSTMTCQWQYLSSTSGNEEANSVRLDSVGHVYLGGYETVSGNKDYYLCKLDTAGNAIWTEYYNGTGNGNDVGEAIAIDANGFPIITGYSWVDPGFNFDYHTMKYDTSGTILWEIDYNGLSNKDDRAYEISIDNQDNIYVIGQSQDSSGITCEYMTVKYVEHELWNVSDIDTVPSCFNITPNWGQLLNLDTVINVNSTVKCYSIGPAVYFENNRLSHLFSSLDSTLISMDTILRVDMKFTTDTTKRVYPLKKRDCRVNYYFDQTTVTNGLCNVPVYEEVVYPEIYKLIDLHVSANSSGVLEQFVVKQTGDPEDIFFTYEGADTIYINGGGNLVIETMLDDITYLRPTCSQIDSSGGYVPIAWQPIFQINGDTVSFDSIQSCNANLPLVIEMKQGPSILLTGIADWSTFLGGSKEDAANDITSDDNGNIYVTGYTGSINFPVTSGAFQTLLGGGFGSWDAFVVKFNSNYHNEWLTYYGGDQYERGFGIAHDPINNKVYICGTGGSSVLAYQFGTGYIQSVGNTGGFIARFDDAVGYREWGTRWGGSNGECYPHKIKVDDNGNVYMVGSTNYISTTSTCTTPSANFYPICNPGGGAFVQTSHNNVGGSVGQDYEYDGFIAKFDANTNLVWSTLFGGPYTDFFDNLVIDNANQKLYVVGSTNSNNQGVTCGPSGYLALCNSGGYFQANLNGTNNGSEYDGLITRFTLGGILEWSTFWGGDGDDFITGAALDGSGSLYLSGYTNTNFYGTGNCVVPTNNGFPHCTLGYDQNYGGGDHDAFIVKFIGNAVLRWSTFVGGDLGEGREARLMVDEIAEALPWGPRVHVSQVDDVYLFGNTRSESITSSTLSVPISYNSSFYNESTHEDSDPTADNTDVFVNLFSGGGGLLWGTYYGGTGTTAPATPRIGDCVGGITSWQGRVFICGRTYSTSNFPLNCPFPGTSYCQGYTTVNPTYSDAFVSQLNLTPLIGIEDVTDLQVGYLDIYPNPTFNWVTITFIHDLDENMNIEIIDILGKRVSLGNFSVNSGINKYTVDLEALSSGLYFLIFKGVSASYLVKVIKI